MAVKVALKHVSLQITQLSLANHHFPLLHTHLLLPHEVCDSPDQQAHCYTLGLNSGASPVIQQLTGVTSEGSLLVYSKF
jgi:hypothetical protein